MSQSNKVVGLWSGHDCSFCVFDKGYPELHYEYERHLRIKEPPGDSIELFFQNYQNLKDIRYFVSCYPRRYFDKYPKSLQKLYETKIPLLTIGHHAAHNSHSFFSSNFNEAMLISLDGGGYDYTSNDLVHEGYSDKIIETAHTVYFGKGQEISRALIVPSSIFNCGGVWTRSVRYIFRLHSGYPKSNSSGTVMSMAAFGDKEKYINDFYQMFTTDLLPASQKPAGQGDGRCRKDDPVHPYLNKWTRIADSGETERFNLAAGLQAATEKLIREIFTVHFQKFGKPKNLCLSGGVSLNSVMVGKLQDWFPFIEQIYIPPVPYDGGLTLGAAQFVSHQIMGIPRVKWVDNFPAYLGVSYNKKDIDNAIGKFSDRVKVRLSNDDEVLDFLSSGKVISVFNGRAESGRRALGNRSILVDARNPEAKNIINQKIKGREWHRPSAPSILKEEVKNWFEKDLNSPYMNFVGMFKKHAWNKVPSVNHVDHSARLQSLSENDNPWYYNFLKKWFALTGVPILLNTSFNNNFPICDSPEHCIGCFLDTQIDYLYFPEYNLLISKL